MMVLNIHQKLWVFVGGAIALAFVIFGMIAVSRTAQLTRADPLPGEAA